MANKRVTELAPISALEMVGTDLFLLTDVSAIESKKLQVSELLTYVQTNITGSTTSSWAQNSKTASYLLYQGFPNGTASFAITSSNSITSSYAIRALSSSYATSASFSVSSSHAIFADSCSYAKTASLSITVNASTASYLYATGSDFHIPYWINNTLSSTSSVMINTDPYGGIIPVTDQGANLGLQNKRFWQLFVKSIYNSASPAIQDVRLYGTASYALRAALANTSSFLYYQYGVPNGTASYAMKALNADKSVTSSYIWYQGFPNGTASYALNCATASYVETASYAKSASRATYADNVESVYKLYGPFAIPLSNPETGAISLSFTSSYILPTLIFEVYGDHGIPFRNQPASNGVITVNATNVTPLATTITVAQSWAHAPLNVSGGVDITGSITQSFALKKYVTSLLSNVKWDFTFNATNCNFQNSYNPLTIWVYSKDCTGVNSA